MKNNRMQREELFTKSKLMIIGLTIVAATQLSSCKDNVYDPVPSETTEADNAVNDSISNVKRGEYLVTVLGCNDCHSPKRMGERGPENIPELLLSGYPSGQPLPEISEEALEKGWILMSPDQSAAVGPWGISYAANLTSDETGIGNWSLEQFNRALTEGKYKGLENSRTLLPPMPWQNFRNMKEDDVKAIFEYLQSTNPVENVVPSPVPPNRLKEML